MNRLKRINSGTNHWYRLDGEYAPGVTTVLSGGIPKPALVNWASKTCAEYVANNREWLASAPGRGEILDVVKGAPNRDRDEAGNKGTIVHDYAEQLTNGDVTLAPEHEFLMPYVQAYAQFLDDAHIEPVATEVPMANTKLRYAGTGDLFAKSAPIATALGHPADSIGYVDLKTNRSGVFMEAGLQCLAYTRCDLWQPNGDDEPMPTCDWSVVVHVAPDGCTIRPVDLTSERHWAMFRAARLIAEATRKKDGWGDLILLPDLSISPTTDLTLKAAS